MTALLVARVIGNSPGRRQLSERRVFGKGLLIQAVKGHDKDSRSAAMQDGQEGHLAHLLRGQFERYRY